MVALVFAPNPYVITNNLSPDDDALMMKCNFPLTSRLLHSPVVESKRKQ